MLKSVFQGKIQLHWVLAHSQIPGNGRAEHEAKNAAVSFLSAQELAHSSMKLKAGSRQ